MELSLSSLLILGIVLTLSDLSSGQNWEKFAKKHITSNTAIDCSVVDQPLYYIGGQCRPVNTFITAIANPNQVRNLCNRYPGRNCYLTTPTFRLVNCYLQSAATKKPCIYTGTAPENSVICIVCDNQNPVHFQNEGQCQAEPAC